MTRPNFLFIGPDKTGSSWMYEILRQHPQCFVPIAKDIWFFDHYYQRGLDWYLSFFESAPDDAVAIGELSHNYLFSPSAAERIAEDFPEMSLMTCLRDPVRRTFSHYLYLVRSGLTQLSFDEALEHFSELTENSLYYKHLSRYLELFPREQIKVLWFPQLADDPEAFAQEMFDFLGVEHVADLEYQQKVRPASKPRSHLIARALTFGGRAVRQAGLANLVGRVKHSRLVRLAYRPYGDAEKPDLSPETERALRQRFAGDVRALQETLNVDLRDWLPEETPAV
ncbi:MAG: sulfotransferase [Salinibacter sp.]